MTSHGSPLSSRSESAPDQPIDRPAAIARLGGDEGLFHDFARSVLDEVPILLGELRAALDGGRLEDAHRTAHGLKGMLATLEALPATAAAREVERLTQEGDPSGAAAATDRLAAELDRLAEALGETRVS